ncbi:MAG: MBOAT family O-acyltransferase [Myxococcota bacterium]
MVFNSISFIVFFAVVLTAHQTTLAWPLKKLLLTVASYLFYAAWNPAFVLLLLLSSCVDYLVGRKMPSARPRAKFWLLQLSLCTNLGLLAIFKYYAFIQTNVLGLMAVFGVELAPWDLQVDLPVGISFYTFQTLSYTLDIYRGRLKPADSFADFALFVAFFPQLVAGPIVRAADFLPQLEKPKQANSSAFVWGLILLVNGLFAKVVLADTLLAPVADSVYGSPNSSGLLDAWIGTFAFAGQIYFDFAGYSTCAIGVALCLGFSLPDNFRRPYGAVGFSDFWERWHVSLSAWLRDYLYISLGGNRGSMGQTRRNLMMTMLLGGLWHGASWTFVAWGALHGAFLILERWVRTRFSPLESRKWIGASFTFLGVCLTWVLFRAESFADAWILFAGMFGTTGLWGGLVGISDSVLTVLVVGSLCLQHFLTRDLSAEELGARIPRGFLAFGVAFMALTVLMCGGNYRSFIYFQF